LAEVLLFHHALGLTPGVVAFADDLRAAGHTVHTPDLYDGRTFTDIPTGVNYARSVGFETVIGRGKDVASLLRPNLVYVGMSLGVMPAQLLAMTRPGARGALFLYGCLPLSEFGGTWPAGVDLQVHVMEDDDDGDVEFAREVVRSVEGAELFLYGGNRHLFADSSVPDQYDAAAADVLRERVLDFLRKVA
jgi:dienelactone hydrolase